jgi:uncharacterized protein (TIGR00369 family)
MAAETIETAAPTLRARLEARLASHPVSALIHPRIEKLELDACELAMPFRTEVSNGYGAIHGGALATLADTAMAFALATNFDGEMGFATADLTIHYFKPARTDVVARARVVKKGRRINVGLVDILDTDGDLVATVLTSFMLTTSTFTKGAS